ncbi:MAG: hypothetical protein NTX79_07785 [Candidatus Micrarchaeota archaeon]|nr:hypothetical protein [Candidatus Micrarchaeota archaeon]
MTKGSEGIKGHEHSASHANPHPSSHEQHREAEFLTQVRALKDAEKGAARRVEDAKAEAARIEAAARESAVEIISKAQQKAVEAKNEILARKREEADAEIRRILDAARKQAGAIKAKRLPDSDIAALAQSV